MDPLSGVLSLLRLHTYRSAGFDFGGDWSIGSGPSDGIRFYAIVSGECRLAVEGVPDAVDIRAGDCLLLPRGRPFRVASDLALEPMDPWKLFPGVKDGGISRLNGGGDIFGIGASPMDYRMRWRMMLAGDRLTNASDRVSEIALSLGYESESAFSSAFKRVMGTSPRRYGRLSLVSGERAAAVVVQPLAS